ncbi:MAG: hypothetical protein GY898_13710 [Proteobacteria bacterium]|nr:hypothetical protein [Pseudomonadota bacterium]
MDSALLLRNRSVHRVVVGVPEGHTHVRARIETSSGDVIMLQEATLAALCRAYVDVTTHPRKHAVELVSASLTDGKDGFAQWQLLEAATAEEQLRAELAAPPPSVPDDAESAFVETQPEVAPLGPDGTTSDGPLGPTPLASAPGDVTMPVPREQLLGPEGMKTDHGRPEADDLELDAAEADDGPVFGDTPTLHSKPRAKAKRRKSKDRGKK